MASPFRFRRKFGTILADPPWQYGDTLPGAGIRGAEKHYPTMTFQDIKYLPVADIAAEDSHLYLWTTNSHLPYAFEVMEQWGFEYKTTITWVKTTNEAELVLHWYGEAGVRVRVGMGRRFRGVTEHCLFGVRGRAPLETSLVATTAFFAPRGEHSAKPGAFYNLVEECSPGPRVELFARARVPGWAAWGNEV